MSAFACRSSNRISHSISTFQSYMMFVEPRVSVLSVSDAYVKVSVSQPGMKMKKTTAVKKNTTAPSFQETFIFPISPRVDDLGVTSVTLTVYNHAHLRMDDAIGQVRLGCLATEESEYEHWNKVLQSPGRMVGRWHPLMEGEDD